VARADGMHELEKLYRVLRGRRFDFVPAGEQNLQAVFSFVRERYPELCNDEYLCSACHKKGSHVPEWQNVVRGVLNHFRSRGGPVSKGHSQGLWLFGELLNNRLDDQFSGPPLNDYGIALSYGLGC
jgi:hypothetical protein